MGRKSRKPKAAAATASDGDIYRQSRGCRLEYGVEDQGEASVKFSGALLTPSLNLISRLANGGDE